MRRVGVALLIALLWTGTVAALGVRVCACSGDQLPITSGLPLATRAEVMAKAHAYAKGVTDAQLSVQQLRNAELQAITLRADNRIKTLVYVGAFTGVVYGVEQVIDKYIDICEKVESNGHQVWVCPF